MLTNEDSKYKQEDIVILRKTPHKGTSYPLLVQELAEMGEPIRIRRVRVNGTYDIVVKGNTYAIFEDEIAGLRKQVALFI